MLKELFARFRKPKEPVVDEKNWRKKENGGKLKKWLISITKNEINAWK